MGEQIIHMKERRTFGRQCLFTDRNELIFTEFPNESYLSDYIRRNPVSTGTQEDKSMSLNEVNTENIVCVSKGINHIEGGWPKDINLRDEEQPIRHIKKIMREDIWVQKLPGLIETAEKSILANGAVSIYEQYFDGLDPMPIPGNYEARVNLTFKDANEIKRPITHLSWSPDGGKYLAASYCDPSFINHEKEDMNSFIWDVENPNSPFARLNTNIPIVSLEFNFKDQFAVAGGLITGQVSVWDTRSGPRPILTCRKEVGHTLRANSVKWTSSKTNSEFMSGSQDGSVFFWDIRKFSDPTEQLLLDSIDTMTQDISRSVGASVLEFEPTIPTKFMVGTEQGQVYVCSRKARTPIDKIASRYSCHFGKIYALQRNPGFAKNFLTVADYSAKIWSEEWKESPIIWTKQGVIPFTNGAWSETKCSLFFITKLDGVLDAYDLLVNQEEPSLSITLSSKPLLAVRSHENGNLVAVSDSAGSIYLVKLSENMTIAEKSERSAFSYMVERETRREKFYDSRMKEVRLKYRQDQENLMRAAEQSQKENTNNIDDDNKEVTEEEEADTQAPIKPKLDTIQQAEEEYLGFINIERERRMKLIVPESKTPFDKDFDFSSVLKPEDVEAAKRDKLNEIKAKVIRGLIKQAQSDK